MSHVEIVDGQLVCPNMPHFDGIKRGLRHGVEIGRFASRYTSLDLIPTLQNQPSVEGCQGNPPATGA